VVDVETLREAIEAYLNLTRSGSKGSKGDPEDGDAAEGDDEPHEAKHLLKLFRTMIDPKKDVLTQSLKKLNDKLFVDEEVLCLTMRSASAAVTARLWERTVTAIERDPGPGRFLDGEIPETPKACESATDTSSAVHAMVILMCPIKKRREFYRHLVEYEWEAVCGAFCYMFLSPHCGPPETLKRICDCLLFLDAEASSKVELDVETAEEMHQMNAKLQQTAVAMVEYLRDYEQEELWYSEVGAEILADFQFVDARLFFFRPRLQRILCDMWHPKYDHVSDWEYMCYVLKFHAGNIMGFILLIPCALCPSLESYVYNRKISMEREIRKKRDADRQKIEKEASEEKSRRMTWKAKTQADTINGKKQKEITDLWMNSCLTILLPRQKKYLAIFTNLAFVAFLVLYDPDQGYAFTILMLSGGALYSEILQLLGSGMTPKAIERSIRLWLMDRVNIAEFIAFGFICVSCIFRLIHESQEGEEPSYIQAMWACGVFFMGMSQGVSLLRMSSVYGPLVSMMVQMIVDMIRWIALLLPIIVSLVGAFITLFKQRSRGGSGAENWAQDTSCAMFHPATADWFTGVLLLFEIQIGKDVPFDCLEASPHATVAPQMLNFGLWLIVILMLNMLIAMMAKTFDRIFEKSMVDYQYNFAGFVLQMRQEHDVPPVLRLFSLPWTLGKNIYLQTCGREKEDKTRGTSVKRYNLRESFFKDSAEAVKDREATPGQSSAVINPTNLNAGLEAPLTDIVSPAEGTLEPGPSIQAPSQNKTMETYELSVHMSKLVEKFLEEHDSDAAFQDEQFRRQVAQKLWKLDSHVEDLIDFWKINTRRSYKAQRAQLRKKQLLKNVSSALADKMKSSKGLSKGAKKINKALFNLQVSKLGKDTE